MIVRILFNVFALATFLGNLIPGMKGFMLALELRNSSLRGKDWNGYVSIRRLKKLMSQIEKGEQKEKVKQTIYYLKLSRRNTLIGLCSIVMLVTLNVYFKWSE